MAGDSARDDPRVVASRERWLATPRWRVIKVWRAAYAHARLLNAVIAERQSMAFVEQQQED